MSVRVEVEYEGRSFFIMMPSFDAALEFVATVEEAGGKALVRNLDEASSTDCEMNEADLQSLRALTRTQL